MRKVIGIICLVAGVVLLVQGHHVAQSLNSQFKQVFTGSPLDRAMYYYIGGTGLSVAGIFLIFWPGKS